MALVLNDRVQETTTTTGTGTVTLAGALTGYQSFAAVGNGNTTYYCITDGTDFEIGLGTYTSSGTTLSRTTVLSSSNSGSLVNFSAGTKNVFVTYPSGKSVNLDASGNSTALGIPVSATLTNATGLPISTGVSGLGTGVATFLATPTTANLAAAVTGETGTGALVFATSPTLVTPLLGTPTSGVLTNATGLPLTTGVTGTLPVANGGTSLATLTANNVILGNGTSAPTFVAPSTNGNVLTSNGTTWTSAAAAGGASALVLLSTVTASASATVDIETTFSSTYDAYLLVVTNYRSSAGSALYITLKIGGTYLAADYQYHASGLDAGSASYAALVGTAATQIVVSGGGNMSPDANYPAHFNFSISGVASTTTQKEISWTGRHIGGASDRLISLSGAGAHRGASTAALTGVRFAQSSGSITSGTFRLYGLANS